MKPAFRLTLALTFLLAVVATARPLAHHGWGGYDDKKPMTLTGVIKASGYDNPHSFVDIEVDGKMWHAVLAPPYRMDARGLSKESIKVGNTITVMGLQSKSVPTEVKIERVTIAGKTYEIR